MSLTNETLEPANVRAAPSHPDPYPYYARLARERPLFRDESIGFWVAASAAAVREVLENPDCFTRPPRDRVPEALRAGRIGDLFGPLVRMSDGPAHAAMKPAIAAALRSLDLAAVAAQARARALALDAEFGPFDAPAKVTRFLFALPTQVLAGLLGVPAARFGDVLTWLGDYGAATAAVLTGAPEPTPDLLRRGHAGASGLLDLMADLKASPGPLYATLLVEAERAGCGEAETVANAAGLLVQGYAAMASVASSTLLALARRPHLQARVARDRTALRSVMQEVLRADNATHSTVRVLARDAVIAGQALREGDRIIVMIAAANQDPALNPEPDRFDVDRTDRRSLEFGAGAHACPADKLAPLLAEVAVEHLLARGVALDRLEPALSYAASAHVRTPRFG